MKKFKFYQFALALVAAVLISAAASELNTATAAPVASAANLQHAVPNNVENVWHPRRHRHRSRRWIGPAIALGVVGAAAAAAAANQGYYGPGPGYYEQPYGYYQAPRERCWVQTDPVYNRGYWTWC
jgi:L,D-peptidoglycan transpeptidase YkuD (ErfK/YbiS/YcfS/YnhG family)